MTAAVIAVISVVVVLAGSLLKSVDWSDKAKNLLVTVLSIVGGVVGVYATGGFDNATDIVTTAGLVYAASQLIYTFIFQGSGLNAALSKVNVFGGSKEPVVQATGESVADIPADNSGLQE
jgi:SNF family Na+-dependent transporter